MSLSTSKKIKKSRARASPEMITVGEQLDVLVKRLNLKDGQRPLHIPEHLRAKAIKFMGRKDFEANLRAMMTPVKDKKKKKKHRTPGAPVVAQPDNNKLNGMKGTTNSGGQREGKKKPSLSAKDGAESPLVKSWADLVDTDGNDTASESISEDDEKPSEKEMKLQEEAH